MGSSQESTAGTGLYRTVRMLWPPNPLTLQMRWADTIKRKPALEESSMSRYITPGSRGGRSPEFVRDACCSDFIISCHARFPLAVSLLSGVGLFVH